MAGTRFWAAIYLDLYRMDVGVALSWHCCRADRDERTFWAVEGTNEVVLFQQSLGSLGLRRPRCSRPKEYRKNGRRRRQSPYLASTLCNPLGHPFFPALDCVRRFCCLLLMDKHVAACSEQVEKAGE